MSQSNIHDALPLQQKYGKKTSNNNLIKKVVTKNLPWYLVKDLIMKAGNTLKEEARKLQKLIEKDQYMSKKSKASSNKKEPVQQ